MSHSDTMTLDEFHKLINSEPKRSKYKNRKVVVDGYKFDSQKEANRYCDLKILQRDRQVSHFFMQVPVFIEEGIIYILDFLVFWTDGTITYEDTKGFKTKVYKLKKKLVENRYPFKLTEL